MGLIFILYPTKILCLIVIMRVDCEEKVENEKMNAKPKKAMVLIKLIKDYRELALTTRDCGEFFGTMMEIDWELGDGDMSEWDERKGDVELLD